jgi:hypothetical protein
MSANRIQIEAAVQQFGWTVKALSTDWIEYTKPVPMIGQRDEYRLVVLYASSGRPAQAFYGPDRRPHELPGPLTSAVVGHLVKWGPHQ